METVKKKTRAGSPNKTWCGVSIALYRRKKKELSHEEFRQWWFNKTGRSLCLRDDKIKSTENWPLVRRLEKELATYKSTVDILDKLLTEKTKYITMLENRSWIQRLFNSKV